MALHFPNQSRSFDATRRAVRFWGHDGAMEELFFVGEDALKKIQPDMERDDAGVLSAFDSNRELIYVTAVKVYGRYRKGSYDLFPGDDCSPGTAHDHLSLSPPGSIGRSSANAAAARQPRSSPHRDRIEFFTTGVCALGA
jgi:Protein of unknown function (DUF1488)